jgi:hypothetical protein
MSPNTARIVFVLEFLVAIVAVLTTWGHLAGQDRIELVPWFWKLLLVASLAFAIVQATAAAAKEENAWNSKTMGWVTTVVVRNFA